MSKRGQWGMWCSVTPRQAERAAAHLAVVMARKGNAEAAHEMEIIASIATRATQRGLACAHCAGLRYVTSSNTNRTQPCPKCNGGPS